MPIPDFQSIMLPLLELASDGKEHTLRESREILAQEFNLSDKEKDELLPSGRQPIFTNRVSWSKVYFTQAGLLQSRGRGLFQITEQGRKHLRAQPEKISVKLLEQYPNFFEFRYGPHKGTKNADRSTPTEDISQTPEEVLEIAHQRLGSELATDVLALVKNSSPQFFEKLVVEVLLSMGYGGSRKEAGAAIGKADDEGIDGVINEDRLGLDVIYIQAKKWDSSVGRPEIQKFVGALHGKNSRKGVFITTGTFTSGAIDYAGRIEPNVVLINGKHLAEFMIDFNVGVIPVATYPVKRVDSDFFNED